MADGSTHPETGRLVAWVAERQGPGGAVIAPDTDLVGEGVLDSLGLVSLFFLVETLRGSPVDVPAALEDRPLTPARIAARWL
jgi:hypothetical protein